MKRRRLAGCKPLLDNATNMFGPLRPELKARLRAFFDNPGEKTWDGIHSILVRPMRTVWQAVHAEDPSFPMTGPVTNSRTGKRTGWARVPDAMLVARAIKKATEKS